MVETSVSRDTDAVMNNEFTDWLLTKLCASFWKSNNRLLLPPSVSKKIVYQHQHLSMLVLHYIDELEIEKNTVYMVADRS